MRMMSDVVDILLVEDNPGDVRLTREALKEAKVRNELHVATDGVEALAFLRREGVHKKAVRPSLVLLDLNLPRKNGREVLAEMTEDHELRRIPGVILSSSQAERDIIKADDLHVTRYINKAAYLAAVLQVY